MLVDRPFDMPVERVTETEDVLAVRTLAAGRQLPIDARRENRFHGMARVTHAGGGGRRICAGGVALHSRLPSSQTAIFFFKVAMPSRIRLSVVIPKSLSSAGADQSSDSPTL